MKRTETDVNAALGKLLDRFADTVCAKYAAQAEQMAKDSAPWKDRTGDARKLLKGVVLKDEPVEVETFKNEGGETTRSGQITIDGTGCVGFALVHRVEYGKYLERDGDGQYAVIKPTIEAIRSDFLKTAREVFGGTRSI